ncbi:MAG: hypothetical protein H6R14_1710 [Proteobacteria bacterium]|nr:hypothetical protein [Pseudomonadota bacterium]
MSIERRGRPERRRRDVGPPKGCIERRRSVERRLPEAAEAELSPDEFAQFFGAIKIKKAPENHELLEKAADIFDRARDR